MLQPYTFLSDVSRNGDWYRRPRAHATMSVGQRLLDGETTETTKMALHEIGSFIWASEDPDDFQARMESIMDDEHLLAQCLNATRGLMDGLVQGLPHLADFIDAVSGAVGTDLRPALEKGSEYFMEINIALLRRTQAGGDWLDTLDSSWAYSSHPIIVDAIMASLDSLVGLCALAHPVVWNTDPVQWLSAHLVHFWVARQGAFLRLLASLPNTQVPEHVIPRSDRMNLEQLQADTKSEQALFQQFIASRSNKHAARA